MPSSLGGSGEAVNPKMRKRHEIGRRPRGGYWKYPFTSKMKWVVPLPCPSRTEIVPFVPRGTMALLARVCPGAKLIVEASGAVPRCA